MYRLHGFCQSGNTFKAAFLLREQLDSAFGILDKHLAGRAFVVGDRPEVVDPPVASTGPGVPP